MNESFPEGWTALPLADFVEEGAQIQYGILQPGPDTEGGVPYVRPTEIRNDRIDIAGLRRTTTEIAERYARSSLASGDVLLSIVGSIGKVAVVPDELAGANITQSSARLRPRRGLVSSNYLAWLLRSPIARALFNEAELGTGVPRLNIGDIRSMELPLAPLDEQRRIVEKVEMLVGGVNAARERLALVPAILKRLRQAIVDAACSGRITRDMAPQDDVPEDWRWLSIGELIADGGLFDGARDHGSGAPVESNLRTSDYTDSGVRVIRLENLGHLHFVDSKRTFISERKYAGLKQSTVFSGDVLVGSFIDHAVRVCALPELEDRAIAKADCFCIRSQQDKVLPRYLALQIACTRTYMTLAEDVHGATRPRISTKQLRSLRVPVCDLSEQRNIVERADALFHLARIIESRTAAAIARADKLTQSILAKAFRGELVPTEAELARQEGREYEPASAVLVRLRSQRGALTGRSSVNRKRVSAELRDLPGTRGRARG